LISAKKAMDFVVMVYEVTKDLPREEEYGLKSQLRRAAVSVPSNIAEGLTRTSKKDKLHFLNIARASLSETDAQLEICVRLNFLEQTQFEHVDKAMADVEMLLSGLARKLKES
jgi:four helix bundle protein